MEKKSLNHLRKNIWNKIETTDTNIELNKRLHIIDVHIDERERKKTVESEQHFSNRVHKSGRYFVRKLSAH